MTIKVLKPMAFLALMLMTARGTWATTVPPGEYTIRTVAKNAYLTARPGSIGNYNQDALITTATTPGPYEKFHIETRLTGHHTIKTFDKLHYVSALAGGGVEYSEAIRTMQTVRKTLEDDTLFYISGSETEGYAIQTARNYYLTALDGGGKYTRAFISSVKKADLWERYRINQCGDLGTGFVYHIVPRAIQRPLWMDEGKVKGGVSSTFVRGFGRDLTFLRQSTGWHALQLTDTPYVLTAAGGGGWSKNLPNGDVLQTNRTQVQAWETFAFMVQPDCTWTIQTANGAFMGVNAAGQISTAIPNPRTGRNLGYSVYFEIVPRVPPFPRN